MAKDNKRLKKLYRKLKWQSQAPLRVGKKMKYLEKQANKMSGKMTWPEKEFLRLMKELKVKVEKQKIIGNKIYDFYIPLKNILIEVDGDYYHGNPLTYKKKTPMQLKNSKNDKYKNTLAIGFGYKIERVWESDLKNNYLEVKKRFIDLLKS